MKPFRALATLTTCALLSTVANAELVQDCVLEGKIKKRNNATMIEFTNAKKHKADAKCKMGRSDKLAVPQDYAIANAPAGTKVSYRYTVDEKAKSEWTLIDLKRND